jgi:anaerobic selenocysteine-containing dehydrogenase
MPHTVYRTCSLCEATCGLAFDVEDNRVVAVRPDADDVFSGGYVCPKGVTMADVHDDPDRLRQPMRKTETGRFEPVSWDEAFTVVAERLSAIRREHGGDAVALYYGNPTVHNHGAILLLHPLTAALGTRNRYSAGSQDANPRVAAAYYLFGSTTALPVPDIDRTHYFLCIGANPFISNGSIMTAPNFKGRMRAVQERGGKVVVVDPRRTETARAADEHVAIRPGTDSAMLLAMIQVLDERGLLDDAFIARSTTGWKEVKAKLAAFRPEAVAAFTGVDAETIERIAVEFAGAPSAVAYSRMGVSVAAHATLANWATDLLNIVTGRLGTIGGPMFPTPAVDLVEVGRRAGLDGVGRWKSRVSGLPETIGDLPSAALVEEIETPGAGQIRALVTYAGNPVLSAPNGRRLDAALEKLDFVVSIDIYVNETTRHADVILPPAWGLTEDHVDLIFAAVSVRNVARWSPAVLERGEDERADWEILLELIERLGGGPMAMPLVDRVLAVARRFGLRWNPTTVVDLLLRLGPYGDRFLPWSKGLSIAKLARAPHGIDLGPMQPGFERRIHHDDQRIHLAPCEMLDDVDRLATEVATPVAGDALVLIGRRELRTNNSWMHNVQSLVAGKERCQLFVHPDDADRYGIADGDVAVLESRVHRGEVRVHVTDEMRPGVVSLPHGWGHAASAPWQSVAGAHPGVSVNDWTDDGVFESVLGQSILNGVPVRLVKAERAAA